MLNVEGGEKVFIDKRLNKAGLSVVYKCRKNFQYNILFHLNHLCHPAVKFKTHISGKFKKVNDENFRHKKLQRRRR